MTGIRSPTAQLASVIHSKHAAQFGKFGRYQSGARSEPRTFRPKRISEASRYRALITWLRISNAPEIERRCHACHEASQRFANALEIVPPIRREESGVTRLADNDCLL